MVTATGTDRARDDRSTQKQLIRARPRSLAGFGAMFTLSKFIPNEGVPSFTNEVCFHPDGKTFGASYEQKDEVRIFDAGDLSLIRVFRNPAAALNQPHGLLLTQKHVIVANKGASPCDFRIFRLDDDSSAPSSAYTTPFPHLAEGHSMALSGRRLVVTYCEGRGKKGAIVSYDYDDDNGRIIGPTDIQERWFRRFGRRPYGQCCRQTGKLGCRA